MSEQRARPWQNPTPLDGHGPRWEGQFDTFQDWVNHATKALSETPEGKPEWCPYVCIDAIGRRCWRGEQFMRARDEGTFPIRYFWQFEPAPPHNLPEGE